MEHVGAPVGAKAGNEPDGLTGPQVHHILRGLPLIGKQAITARSSAALQRTKQGGAQGQRDSV
jgi:hypothetical protein